MRVGRHRGDAREPEVERRHRGAEPLRPREHEAAEAGVDVAADAALARELGELLDRIDDAVGEARRRADDDRCVAGDRRAGGVDVGAQIVGADRHLDELHAEVAGRLVERGVGGGRRDDLGALDLLLGAGAIPIGLHGQEDALGAARRDHADDLALDVGGRPRVGGREARAEHVGGHRHDLGLELGRARPQVRVQRVLLAGQRVDPAEELDVLGIAVVDGARDEAVAPARRLALVHRLDLRQELGARSTLAREPVVARELVAVGLGVLAQAVDHLLELVLDPIADAGDLLGQPEHLADELGA